MVLRTEKYKSSSGFTYLKLPCMLTVYLSLCRTGVGGAGGERREKGGWNMHTVTENNDRLKVG